MKREKLEILYSIGVLVAIPLLVIVNTVLLIRSTQGAFNTELMRKADLVNAVVAEASRLDLVASRYENVSSVLRALEESEPSLRGLMVVQEKDGTMVQVAKSGSAPDSLTLGSQLQSRIVFERKTPIAKFMNAESDGKTAQMWNVVTPLQDSQGKVIAVVSSNMLTTDADEAINRAYGISFMVLVGSVIVIVGLLFRHFRLVGYAQLLTKQKEVNQTMSDFLSVATHELKAPTAIIKGYLSNVMDGTFGPIDDTIKKQLETAYAQTDRLNELVRDLLNVSRIEQGRIEYTITAVDTRNLLEMIVTNYHSIAADKGLELRTDIPESIPMVSGDAGRLQEIFTNLIDNAIKYTPHGTVIVSQRVDKNMVITSVKDTGFGMSPEARRRLFQRFYRIRTSQTQDISGTGLGLWIIKQYIEAMGGWIEVESIEGTGSNFIVAMPTKN